MNSDLMYEIHSLSYSSFYILFESFPSVFRHQPTTFKFLASLFIEFRPMTAFPAGGQPLCQSPVGEFLQRGVNPAEAEGFLYDIEVRKRVGLRHLRPVAGYPATAFREKVPFKPLPQLSAIGEG